MKHEMKRLISFIALLVMLVSMFSVCVFPAAAADSDAEYLNLLAKAKVVNPAWSGMVEGTPISFDYRGVGYTGQYDEVTYFSSVEDAWAQAKKDGTKHPVILLCAGEYNENMYFDGGVTLLGPNAGVAAVDPESKASTDMSKPWEKNDERFDEAIIKANVAIYVIRDKSLSYDFTFDGLKFGNKGAILDQKRTAIASEMSFKNLVFENAGNSELAKGYAINLFFEGDPKMERVVHLDNLYITGQSLEDEMVGTYPSYPNAGFISSYFTELYATNIAYINNASGFLPRTYFGNTVEPFIEISDSCFHNSNVTARGYVISMDSASVNFVSDTSAATDDDVWVTNSTNRPGSHLLIHDNIFYNASAPGKGVFHFELINKNSIFDLQNNYVYADTVSSVLEAEFLVDSSALDQSACFVIKNNRLIGTYLIPSMQGVNPYETSTVEEIYTYANDATHIDMSDNYFGDVNGNCVYTAIPVNENYFRLIRPSFWVDEKMTVKSNAWDLAVTDWALSTLDQPTYKVNADLYKVTDSNDYSIGFAASDAKSSVQLYLTANRISDGVVEVSNAIAGNKITDSLFSGNSQTIYAQVTNSDYPNFKPVYTITLNKTGSLLDAIDFDSVYSGEYLMYAPDVNDITSGTELPYKWQGTVYKMTVGENIFGSVEKLMAHAKKTNVAVPTILVPAGTYDEEMVLTGSCVVLGELHGVNPNKKPYETIGQNELLSSAWTLDERWADASKVSLFNACIRVDAALDDYIITIDGIKMGRKASFVDDSNRQKDNVLIFKNVHMESAGGGVTTQSGADNEYLFQFSKTTVGKDILNVYVYDSRIEKSDGYSVFGPYIERLELDGVYVGAVSGGSFINALESRNATDPCVSVTNSYFDHSAYGKSGYSLITLNESGNIGSKSNIIYNFDNNVFLDAFPAGAAGLDVYFTGRNMKLYFTNNIVYDAENEDVIFGAYKRFVGSCATEDCSDMIVFKGNRLIKWNRLPMTDGTGVGTMIDFSGNYFAESLNDAQGLMPVDANVDLKTGANLGDRAATIESYTRRRMDYTYLDWDMTIRSDATNVNDVSFSFNSGMFGTGVVSEERIGGIGEVGKIFRDVNIPADCEVYAIPFTASEYADVKIYTNAACTKEFEVDELKLTSSANVFYVKATAPNGKVAYASIELFRQLNTDCSIVAFDDFLIDEAAKTITGYVSGKYVYQPSLVKAAVGATVALYEENGWQPAVSNVLRPTAGAPVVRILKVTNEAENKFETYKLVLNYVSDVATVKVAGVTAVEGMTLTAGGYMATVSPSVASFSFKPIAFMGSDLKVYNGTALLTPDANGVYTVANSSVEQVLRLVATNGSSVKTYLLTFEKKASLDCELLSLEDGVKTEAGYTVLFYLADAKQLKATVSDGATYGVYADYACTTAYANDIVTLKDSTKSFAYIKVTSENGKASRVYKVTLLAQPGNRNATPVVTGKVGNTEYTAVLTGENEFTLYLPAGATSVTLSAKYALKDASAQILLYADPAHAIALSSDLSLNTKVTKAYMVNRSGTYSWSRVIPKSADGDNKEVTLNGLISGDEWVINVVSDRAAVTYTDAPYIADWVLPYVEYLNNGNFRIFEGDTDGKFNAGKNITRNEIVAVATRVMGLDVAKYSGVALKFDDSIAEWVQPYLKAAVSTNMINGISDGTGKVYFRGGNFATREQVIKILVTIMMNQDGITDAAKYYDSNKNELDQYYNVYNFADEDKVAAWAVPYMHLAVAKYELVNGIQEGGRYYLQPKTNIKRSQVAKIVACMLDY